MRFVPISKLVIVATACALLTGCSQAASTQPYDDAEIRIGESAREKIVVTAPEATTAPKASDSPEATPVPNLALPGEVKKETEAQVSSICEGVANEIAYHFDGLMKCDQLKVLVAEVQKAAQVNAEQLLTLVLAWKNEHCLAPAPFDKQPIYPVNPDGPKHEAVPLPYDPSSKETHAEPMVYELDYVPCTLADGSVAPAK